MKAATLSGLGAPLGAPSWRAPLKQAERWLAAVSVPAAVAVVGEVGVLLYGVVMRFVFDSPVVCYYAACTIGRVNPDAAMLKIWPHLGVLVLGLLIVAAVPWISTGFLPH